MNTQRDQLWKLAFRMMMQQIVEFYFYEHYDEIDWSKEPVFLDKELNAIQMNSRPKNRIADVLVMLTLKTGEPIVLFLHIEVQGYVDSAFSFREHQMGYRIEDKMGQRPVMLAIFTDDDPNFHPKEYYVEKWGSSSRSVFNTYKVMEHAPSTYRNPDNPMSLIMEIVYKSTQIKKMTDDEIMKAFADIVKNLLSKGYPKEYILLMKNFVEEHIKFGNFKNYRTFEKKMDKMVKYETTADILSYWNFERKYEVLEKSEKKVRLQLERTLKTAERERQEKERERQEKIYTRERTVLGLLAEDMSKIKIAKIVGISIEEIDAIEEKYKDNNLLTDFLNTNLDN